ncbi:MAG: endonuclease/exonuclease/phosphatase family protein [Phycisphaeraceae bacterium]|nr:endonuclease/exonuclease/phosphatase family protein [Phycisphaeraceae bacterium]
MLRMMTWNILHGGGARRVPEIVLALLEHAPDVIVLTEYRVRVGGQLRAVLADHGWRHQVCSDPPDGTNGVLIASRLLLRPTHLNPFPGRLGYRFVEAEVEDGSGAWRLAGVHVPEERHSTKKAQAWSLLARHAEAIGGVPAAIVGDFNTGRHREDEQGETFTCVEYLGRLWTLGYRDAWREMHPSGREFTWFSPDGGGFRIDHTFLSASLEGRLSGAYFSHAERMGGLSDHSSLIVTLD